VTAFSFFNTDKMAAHFFKLTLVSEGTRQKHVEDQKDEMTLIFENYHRSLKIDIKRFFFCSTDEGLRVSRNVLL